MLVSLILEKNFSPSCVPENVLVESTDFSRFNLASLECSMIHHRGKKFRLMRLKLGVI